MTAHYLVTDASATGWEQTIYAFLAEKERRSGSMRTVETYSRMLFYFFGALGKPPDQVDATEVFSYAHGVGLSGKKPGSVTIGARIACLSSFYRFLMRMGLIAANPCDQLERPKATQTNTEIRRFRGVVPYSFLSECCWATCSSASEVRKRCDLARCSDVLPRLPGRAPPQRH